MRTTFFDLAGDEIVVDARATPAWHEVPESQQQDVTAGQAAETREFPEFLVVMHRLPVGSKFPVHSGPYYSFCQLTSGRGTMVLADGREFQYSAPELYVFAPGALHGWKDITEETVLSVCLVKTVG